MFRHLLRGGICVSLVLMMAAPSAYALTDPTRPGQYHAAGPKIHLKLESVLFSESRRVAVINGKVLAEGERIGSAKVVSIGKDSVRLRRGGKTVRLTLQAPTIRQEK